MGKLGILCCQGCSVPTFCIDPSDPLWVGDECSYQDGQCCRCLVFGADPVYGFTGNWTTICTEDPILDATLTEHCVREYFVQGLPKRAYFTSTPSCPLPDEYCCPDPCYKKVGETDILNVLNYKAYGMLSYRPYSLEVCVYQDNVTCGTGPTELKWIVRSKITYEYVTDSYNDTVETYTRTTSVTDACYKKKTNADFTETQTDNGVCSQLNFTTQGYFCFERIKFYDERPEGLITFTATDLLNDCVLDLCEVGDCYDLEVCITLSTCSPCWCNLTPGTLTNHPRDVISACSERMDYRVVQGCDVGDCVIAFGFCYPFGDPNVYEVCCTIPIQCVEFAKCGDVPPTDAGETNAPWCDCFLDGVDGGTPEGAEVIACVRAYPPFYMHCFCANGGIDTVWIESNWTCIDGFGMADCSSACCGDKFTCAECPGLEFCNPPYSPNPESSTKTHDFTATCLNTPVSICIPAPEWSIELTWPE